MRHRHIDDTTYTLPAIDSIIEHGHKHDWARLQIAVRSDPNVCEKVLKIAEHNLSHPFTIRYHFWYHYARKFSKSKRK